MANPKDFPQLPDAGTREELSPLEWRYLFLETSGEAVRDLKVSEEFLEAQRISATSEAKSKTVEPPQWARRLIAEKAGYAEILQEAASRSLRAPSEETLREVYWVLREIGRDPKGAEEIAKVLTQENLDKILR
ncbi:MAG TPA: hypothetical protein VJ276_19520 [Thermoanaerobaculia bacterium]|nr:hypothetical protein [Thermoanaerobaculia bacterium]